MQKLSRQESDEKKLIARKNYQEFINKMELKYSTPQSIPKVKTEVILLTNVRRIHDYYFTDHDLTPTSIYDYINQINKKTVARKDWVKEIWLHKKDYESLLTMIANPSEPLIIKDVIIVSLED